jgi:FkbM family methyltransferase
MIKDIKFFLQKIFSLQHIILKKRILRSIKNKTENEYLIIPKLCNKNLLSLDVGVFRGVYSFLLSQHSKLVIGFEANPLVYLYINENLKKIINNIEIYNIALSNKLGDVILRVPYRKKSFFKKNFEDYYEIGLSTIHQDNNLGNKDYENFTVKSSTLNNFSFNTKVGFIKIDTEGHEQLILEGATNILSNDKPNLLIEIEAKHRGNNVNETFYYLKNYGYKSYIFYKEKLTKISGYVQDDKFNNYIFKYS